MAYTDSSAAGLWVADLANDTRTQILTGSASYPDWADDGSKIAIARGSGIATVKPDGTSLQGVLAARYLKNVYISGYGHPHFSAGSTHITCVGILSTNNGTQNDVLRATASGSSLTNLTNTPSINELPTDWR